MPPNILGLRFSSASKWYSLKDSRNRCSTYSLDACTRCTEILVRGIVQLHYPCRLLQPCLRKSCRVRPSGLVALGLPVCSQMACVTV